VDKIKLKIETSTTLFKGVHTRLVQSLIHKSNNELQTQYWYETREELYIHTDSQLRTKMAAIFFK
jgi:hypothetical protein